MTTSNITVTISPADRNKVETQHTTILQCISKSFLFFLQVIQCYAVNNELGEMIQETHTVSVLCEFNRFPLILD